ncbi:unnamed protein product [Moneuplotes crassus]|uniref:Uncharacterized protein n=2 Tax=Euplotes crassus TaxID=5936 RepID=A0AAD1XYM2_EUPCR|nr:unnamed protein product [Moneuplotes crassus]
MQYNYLFKIVIIGDSNVGKSCLLIRFADDCFTENYITTIGVDFRFRTLNIGEKNVKLQIWDTAGQERYRTITNAYYRGADAIVLVADSTDMKSFEDIPDWLTEVSKYVPEDTYKILLINKSDVSDEEKVITEEHMKKFQEELGIIAIETSAKTGHNVDEAFINITKHLLEKKTEEGGTDPGAATGSMLSMESLKEKYENTCCGG